MRFPACPLGCAKATGQTPRCFATKASESVPEKIRTYHLLTFSSDDPDVFYQGGEIIYFDKEAVGQVTTAAYRHKLGRPLAMGYIKAPREVRDMVGGGGGFEIDYAGRMTAVAASRKPLYDPDSRRPRELDRQEGTLP